MQKVLSLIQQLQDWISQSRARHPEVALNPLPPDLQQHLACQLRELPHAPAYGTTIQAALTQAVLDWQTEGDAPNCLVILSSPVEPIAEIVQEALQTWTADGLTIDYPLPWFQRPTDSAAIAAEMQRILDASTTSGSSDRVEVTDENRQSSAIAVIPDLAQCFVRCIGGWASVERLRDAIICDRSRFWLLGCNRWAWQFLNSVCQIQAYLEPVKELPALTDTDLEQWLSPIVDFTPVEASDAPTLESFWKALANRAQGSESVAADLWLRSLGLSQPDIETATPTEQPVQVWANQPTLAELPTLNADDRYILHSLLIHARMTLAQLALSLGDSESWVQARIQLLLRRGILIRQQGWLSVHPAHYPRVKLDLSNNNFFVGDD